MPHRHLDTARRPASWTAAALATAALILISGCTSSGSHSPAAPTFGAHVARTSYNQVTAAVDTAYRSSPAIKTYSVDQLQYNTKTRNTVLGVCRHGGAASDESALQSSRVTACAPLIYFFYSYGKTHAANSAYRASTAIYNYALTSISGPFSTQASLNKLLRGWKIPVTADGTIPAPNDQLTRLLNAARAAMTSTAGVHLTVRATSTGTDRHASFTVGRTSAIQTLQQGNATGELRVTPAAAYFHGNAAGLHTFFGIPTTRVAAVGGQWVNVAKGTSQYASLGANSMLAALTPTILPSTTAVTVTPATDGGVKVERLTWTTFQGDASTPVARTLDLATDATHLPVQQTAKTSITTQTVHYTQWGSPVTATAPASSISFSEATKTSK